MPGKMVDFPANGGKCCILHRRCCILHRFMTRLATRSLSLCSYRPATLPFAARGFGMAARAVKRMAPAGIQLASAHAAPRRGRTRERCCPPPI